MASRQVAVEQSPIVVAARVGAKGREAAPIAASHHIGIDRAPTPLSSSAI